jgi:hypothetical protein
MTDTLVVCMNEEQRHRAREALAMPAQYELIGSALTGHRFSKIIVMLGGTQPWTETEIALYTRIIREDLPTKLKPGGKLYVI